MEHRESMQAPADRDPPGDVLPAPANSRAPGPGSRIQPSDYRSPWWLRNPHLQSTLASSPMRRNLGARAIAATGAMSTAHIVDGGGGVRLNGLHSIVTGREPRGLALLLHGWEGSTESSYMRLTAATLLQRGFDVFRLNFRDHGDNHHLNEALFHSNRIDEVVQDRKSVV